MKQYFNVGDPVNCLIHGEGIVIYFDNEPTRRYPLRVEFKSTRIESYTFDGRHFQNGNVVLFQSNLPIPVMPENVPLSESVTFEPGELVWVFLKNQSYWVPLYFSHESNGQYFIFDSQNKSGNITMCVSNIQKFDDKPF